MSAVISPVGKFSTYYIQYFTAYCFSYLSLVGYMASIFGSNVPNNIVIKILSYLPFVSPTLMPGRLAMEMSTLTQAYIALALQLVALVFVAKFGEHIYAKNVLSYSDEKIFKQFIQNLKK